MSVDPERAPSPTLDIPADAVEEIARHGGCLYVWADGAGMKHTGYQPSKSAAAKEWVQLDAAGVRVCVDGGIPPPTTWVIALRHVPYRHVTAIYNGYVPSWRGS